MVYSSVSSAEQMAHISHRVEVKSRSILPFAQGTPRMMTSRIRIICPSRLEVPVSKSLLWGHLHPGWCETCQQLWSHRGRAFSSRGDPRQLAPRVLGILCCTYYGTRHSSLPVLGREYFLSAPSGLQCLHKAQGEGESLWK